jgi:hypothetical protein
VVIGIMTIVAVPVGVIIAVAVVVRVVPVEGVVIAPEAQADVNRGAGIERVVIERVVVVVIERVVVPGEVVTVVVRPVVIVVVALVIIAGDGDAVVLGQFFNLDVGGLTVVVVFQRSHLRIAAGQAEEHEPKQGKAQGTGKHRVGLHDRLCRDSHGTCVLRHYNSLG